MDESDRLIVVSALGPPARATEAWRQWRATVPIAEATAMLTWSGGYIYRNLASADVDEPYLAGIYRHNLLTNSARLRAALPTLAALNELSPITPLKSFGMGAETHARGLRPLADVDVWLPLDRLHDAAAVLRSHGLAPLHDVDDREFNNRIVPQRGSWNFVNPRGIDIDLHWRLLDHMDDPTSRRLVDENSSPDATEFGQVRRLNDELMLCCLVTHFRMSGTLFSHGLFDIAHLLQRVDPDRTAELAAEITVAGELLETVTALRDLIGEGATLELDKIAAALEPHARLQPLPVIVEPPLRGERIPPRYDEAGYLAHPRLYRWWTGRGRPAWFERLVCRWGGFTRRPNLADRAELRSDYPRGGGILGPGWHYRYPGDEYRWANLPDARVLFREVPRSTRRVRIELSKAWAGTGADRVFVRANGRELGVIDRTTAIGDFTLETSRHLELSLRPVGDRRYIGTGIAEQSYRLLAPVRSIELLG